MPLPLNGSTGLSDKINNQLTSTQAHLTQDFSVTEWLGLETIYFRFDAFGVSSFLNSLMQLSNKQPDVYQHFRKTFLQASAPHLENNSCYGDWGMFLEEDFESQMQRLSKMPAGALHLWQTLVDAHYKVAGTLNFSEMFRAFEQLLGQLKAIEIRHQLDEGSLAQAIPKTCAFKEANNFFTSIYRLYLIIENALDPLAQIKDLSGLSLSPVGAVRATKDGFYHVRASMALTPSHTPEIDTLTYAAAPDAIIAIIRDTQCSFESLVPLLHRQLGKEKIHAGFETYDRVQNRLINDHQLTPQDKKLALALCVWTSIGAENFNALSPEGNDLEALISHLIQAQKIKVKKNEPALLSVLVPLPFTEIPSLQALNKFLTCCDLDKATTAQLTQAVQTMNEWLSKYGVVAWSQLLRDDVTSFTDLGDRLSKLKWDKSSGFLANLDGQLAKFDLDEQQIIRNIIRSISADEDINILGPRLLAALIAYKATHPLNSMLVILYHLVRQPACSLQQAITLTEQLTPLQIPTPLIAALGQSKLNICNQDEGIIASVLVPGLSKITKDLSKHTQQFAAIQCLQGVLQAALTLTELQKQELVDYFIDCIKQNSLQPANVALMMGTLSPKALETLHTWKASSNLPFVLNSSPALLNIACQYDKTLGDLFLTVISKQHKLPTEEQTTEFFKLIQRFNTETQAQIAALYQKPPYPPISAFLKHLHSTPINLQAFDTAPYGDRALNKQLNNTQVLRVLSNFDSLMFDDRFNEAQRILMKQRLDHLQTLAKTMAMESTDVLKASIQNINIIADETDPTRQTQILTLIAQLRELAYRLVPGSHEKGLFANTTQLITVLDAVFNHRNLCLQVATGEGKSLISALICSCNTLIYKKPIDLITSNPTLAGRDQDQFALFYDTCAIKTSLIQASDPLSTYLQQGTGINVSDVGSMNLFQLRHHFEGNLVEVDNLLLLDEGDDTLLDNLTTFNHPINLKGDSALTTSPIVWIYPLIMEFINTEEFANSPTRADDVNLAIRYLEKRQNVSFKSLAELKEEINAWLDAAIIAKNLVRTTQSTNNSQERYVVIDEKRVIDGEEVSVKYARIVTGGRVDYQAQWGDGVHQLVHAELNNQLIQQGKTPQFVMEAEQDIVLSRSAKNFIRQYKKNRIISLTATSGSDAERYECRRKYAMDFHVIPPHNPLNRLELPTWYAEDDKHFTQLIIEQITLCQQQKKPFVIICETPKEVTKLYEAIKGNKKIAGVPLQTLTGSNPKQEAEVVAKAGKVGMVTIATAMISRGTDIHLKKPEKGFRVLQTYLAKDRVNIQIKGRTARQGQSGEYGVLLNLEHYKKELNKDELPHRYYRKYTSLLMQLWGSRELQDTITRKRMESVADIKNILNEMYVGLKCICKKEKIAMDDQTNLYWNQLLKSVDDKAAELSKTKITLHEQIGELVDFCAEAWEIFWKKQPEKMTNAIQELEKTMPQFHRPHFYQHYAWYIQEEDTYWFDIAKDQGMKMASIPLQLKVKEPQPDNLDDKKKSEPDEVDLKATRSLFITVINQWNTDLKKDMKRMSDAVVNDLEAMSDNQVATPAFTRNKHKLAKENSIEAVQDIYIRHKYDRNLDGFAKVYSSLFVDTRSLLFGDRPLFANFRAWLNGHGTLFADTRAWWNGTRPLFASVRMFFKRRKLEKEIAKLDDLSATAADDKKIILSDLREQYQRLRNTFFSNAELDKLNREVANQTTAQPPQKK